MALIDKNQLKAVLERQNAAKNIIEPLIRIIDTLPEQPVEWEDEYREEDLRTRFAFYTYKNEEDDGVLYLSNVFVEEASRNAGFGTKILEAAEKVAETIGAITICVKVKQNSPANAWYRKRGYGYIAFEGEYDWLEKNLEYLKPKRKEQPVEGRLEMAARHVWESWNGGTMDDVRRDMKALGNVLNARKEQPASEELEKEIKRYRKEEMPVVLDSDLNDIARHFAEWGAEHLRDSTKMIPEGLEEAAKKFVGYDMDTDNLRDYEVGIEAFKAGAEWDRAKMLEKSYLATISANNTIPVLPMKDVSDLGLDYGDKVRVIVIKKD